MSAKNKEIVDKLSASLAEGGVEEFLAHCAEDVIWTMVGDKTTKGKSAIREWMASMDQEPPQVTVANIIAEGDFVTAHGHMTLREKDGKNGPYAYCDIYRFRDGKIVELNSFVVTTAAKAQSASGD